MINYSIPFAHKPFARRSVPLLMSLLAFACTGAPETGSSSSVAEQAISSSAAPASSAPVISSSAPASSSSLPASSSSLLASSSSLAISSSSVAASSSAPAISDNLKLVIAINAGSTTATTYEGVEYKADKYSTGGTANNTTDPIAGVSEGTLFQTERYGTYGYEIPVIAGTYTIELHLAEIYHNAAGLRSFDLTVENSKELSALDLYSQAGHDGAFDFITNAIAVNDGKLNINLVGLTDAGTLAGFAVYSANGGIDTSVPEPVPSNCNGYVGITYDDGPVNTANFVNALKQADLVPVTFFVNGANINSNNVAQMLTVGEVQNHLYTHTNMVENNWSYSQAYNSLKQNSDKIEAAGAPRPTIFRPPNGAASQTHKDAASSLGMITINWDVDSGDWMGAGTTSTSQIVSKASALQNGQVILMHENQGNTLQAIPQIAANLKARNMCPGRIDPKTGKAVAP